jgi:hypothetical protein
VKVDRKLVCAAFRLPGDATDDEIRAVLAGPSEEELIAAYAARYFPELCPPLLPEDAPVSDEPTLRDIEAAATRPGFSY